MEYASIEEVAKRWGISTRRIQILCADGKIEGATRFGRSWMLPKNAERPVDGRTKAGRNRTEEDMPLPRKTPFLYMTDLYTVGISPEKTAEALSYNHEAQVLFEAEIAYSRGEIDKVYERANYLLNKHSGFYAVLSAGMLLALCAIWKGDLSMWRKAKVHIMQTQAKTDHDRELTVLAITAVDSMLYDVENFPDWFKIGRFDPLPKDALPAAKVYYAKYLYATAAAMASGNANPVHGLQGLTLMKILPITIEPMISQARAEGMVIPEAYLRLTCAVTYHFSGNDEQAIRHIDRALEIVLPDKLYGLLAEYCRTIGDLIEYRLRAVDEGAWEEVKSLYKIYVEGWRKLNSQITGRHIIEKLSEINRRVARLAAFKLSDKEIAVRTNLSLAGVKQAIRSISEKSGLPRSEFGAIL